MSPLLHRDTSQKTVIGHIWEHLAQSLCIDIIQFLMQLIIVLVILVIIFFMVCRNEQAYRHRHWCRKPWKNFSQTWVYCYCVQRYNMYPTTWGINQLTKSYWKQLGLKVFF